MCCKCVFVFKLCSLFYLRAYIFMRTNLVIFLFVIFAPVLRPGKALCTLEGHMDVGFYAIFIVLCFYFYHLCI